MFEHFRIAGKQILIIERIEKASGDEYGARRGKRSDFVFQTIEVDARLAAYGSIDGIVINPAAYTHTSVAILDALKAVAIPAVEVHISDVDAREPFRQLSYPGMACIHTIKGHGLAGYAEAIRYLELYLKGAHA